MKKIDSLRENSPSDTEGIILSGKRTSILFFSGECTKSAAEGVILSGNRTESKIVIFGSVFFFMAGYEQRRNLSFNLIL